MTVREMLMSGVWVRQVHTPEVATRTIVELEKMLTYQVVGAQNRHGKGTLGAGELTAEEYEGMETVLKRIMEEALDRAAQLEGVGLATVAEMMAQTYESKNRDYGDSFGETQERYGVVAGAVRIHDKVSRMVQLTEGHERQVNDESLGDTVRDLATYAAMVRCWMMAGRTEQAQAAERGCQEEEYRRGVVYRAIAEVAQTEDPYRYAVHNDICFDIAMRAVELATRAENGWRAAESGCREKEAGDGC